MCCIYTFFVYYDHFHIKRLVKKSEWFTIIKVASMMKLIDKKVDTVFAFM